MLNTQGEYKREMKIEREMKIRNVTFLHPVR